MSIEMNMETRLGIQPEGNPSVSAVSCGSQYVSDRRADRKRFGWQRSPSAIGQKWLVYQRL